MNSLFFRYNPKKTVKRVVTYESPSAPFHKWALKNRIIGPIIFGCLGDGVRVNDIAKKIHKLYA